MITRVTGLGIVAIFALVAGLAALATQLPGFEEAQKPNWCRKLGGTWDPTAQQCRKPKDQTRAEGTQ